MSIYDAIEISKKNKKASQITSNVAPTPAMPTPTPEASIPTFEAVTVNIAGTNHRINCPSNEVANLQTAALHIHDKMLALRQNIKDKNISNENLLVLICLELYDQIGELQTQQQADDEQRQRHEQLLAKILKDAQSIL